MFNRAQIEKLLKINGVDIASSDDEIKSVLISARWNKDDVDTAVLILRENKKNKKVHVDSLHKVFTTNDNLKPETISALLGIDMDISSEDIELHRKRAKGQLTSGLVVHMVLVSLALSFIFALSSMWYLRMGIFYPALW